MPKSLKPLIKRLSQYLVTNLNLYFADYVMPLDKHSTIIMPSYNRLR